MGAPARGQACSRHGPDPVAPRWRVRLRLPFLRNPCIGDKHSDPSPAGNQPHWPHPRAPGFCPHIPGHSTCLCLRGPTSQWRQAAGSLRSRPAFCPLPPLPRPTTVHPGPRTLVFPLRAAPEPQPQTLGGLPQLRDPCSEPWPPRPQTVDGMGAKSRVTAATTLSTLPPKSPACEPALGDSWHLFLPLSLASEDPASRYLPSTPLTCRSAFPALRLLPWTCLSLRQTGQVT